jgi:hypothetical protein
LVSAAELLSLAIGEVAFLIELILDLGVDRGELLQYLHSTEPKHYPLSPPVRQVAVFDPDVGPAFDFLLFGIAQLLHRSPVRVQTIGGDGFGRTVALQHLLQVKAAILTQD